MKMLSHKAFLKQAREHQEVFLKDRFGERSVRPPRVQLSKTLASSGANFVDLPVVRESLRRRFPGGWRDGLMPESPLFNDMLRSQHIPFNLFAPLISVQRTSAINTLFSELLNCQVAEVRDIQIEHAPREAQKLLHDNTCFDVFVELELQGQKAAAVGVEVKYTEGSYSWGKTERQRMFDEASEYCRITSSSGIYHPGALSTLRTPRQKQMWRNQLLGECLMQTDPRIGTFWYVYLYPARSEYQHEVAVQYEKLVRKDNPKALFLAITYEDYLSVAERTVREIDGVSWVAYARERYLF
jgi:hypothetical protein